MSNRVEIRFRAKRDDFAGGEGYKVPSLKSHHVTDLDRTMRTKLWLDCRDEDIRTARLKQVMSDNYWPGVVWVDESRNADGWVIKPIGKGFMADISITVDLSRKK